MTYSIVLEELRIHCERCSGLCCVALYCSKSDGFPEDKQAEVPCRHLRSDFKCDMHAQLVTKHMKGCLTYECFGAGQRVTQMYASLGDWATQPRKRKEIYEVFLIMTQLYQMRWYLLQAREMEQSVVDGQEIEQLILENEQIANLEPQQLITYGLGGYRERTNGILKEITKACAAPTSDKNKSFFGKNFKGKNLDGQDMSMSLMIASNLEKCSLKGTNFLGADLRDANIKNTDLRESLFLTQMQINSAKGNGSTQLPDYLSRPSTWK
ncbi:MAG: pentapeptide repeat-containing protein [Cellulosilyticaceae bacterium]